MDEQMMHDADLEAQGSQVKACPTCGGTWPASRSHCLACGASLAGVVARSPADRASDEGFDWRWLDALAPEEGSSPEPTSDTPSVDEGRRPWWQFWR